MGIGVAMFLQLFDELAFAADPLDKRFCFRHMDYGVLFSSRQR
jgi:hypothetical protein